MCVYIHACMTVQWMCVTYAHYSVHTYEYHCQALENNSYFNNTMHVCMWEFTTSVTKDFSQTGVQYSDGGQEVHFLLTVCIQAGL